MKDEQKNLIYLTIFLVTVSTVLSIVFGLLNVAGSYIAITAIIFVYSILNNESGYEKALLFIISVLWPLWLVIGLIALLITIILRPYIEKIKKERDAP